jgi:hypothetical protein
MSSYEVPLYGPGWNLVSYPLQVTMTVPTALASIDGYYSVVYAFEPAHVLTQPWKMYSPLVPLPLNDLQDMVFGHGYWISATSAITWQVSATSAASAPVEGAGTAESPPDPPATYWGAVRNEAGFAPATGMKVWAWVDGSLCGQGKVVDVGGQPMYVVHVSAAGEGLHVGCGAKGKTVTFWVDGQPMAQHVPWGTRQVWQVDLSPLGEGHKIHLPYIMR